MSGRSLKKRSRSTGTCKAFAEAGLDVTYHSADIANRDALEKLLAEIRRTSGPITGIVHGAGFERAASFEKKKLELVDATIRAKVDGAANLMALTRTDPLRFFVMFGSVSGRFGGVGQTDYCLANEMLAKLGAWYRKQRPDCPVTTFHWHAWDDVGMAVRPESKHIAKLHNITFMPAREGTRASAERNRRRPAGTRNRDHRTRLLPGQIRRTPRTCCRHRRFNRRPNPSDRRRFRWWMRSSSMNPAGG